MRLTAAAVIALAACAAPDPDTPAPAPAPAPAADRIGANVRVSGSVSYRQRIALPDSALVTVPFEIAVPAARVAANHSYAAQARIGYDGKLRWITTQSYPVLTRGAGNTVELRVDPVAD
jgi:uncharacterized lipoprotein YbaY